VLDFLRLAPVEVQLEADVLRDDSGEAAQGEQEGAHTHAHAHTHTHTHTHMHAHEVGKSLRWLLCYFVHHRNFKKHFYLLIIIMNM